MQPCTAFVPPRLRPWKLPPVPMPCHHVSKLGLCLVGGIEPRSLPAVSPLAFVIMQAILKASGSVAER